MFAQVPGARLWYEDTGGSGPALVLLHARTGNAAMWSHQLPAFSKAGYRCIAYDRRDSGRSQAEPGAGGALPSDDLRFLVDGLGIDRFHLLGTAAGGIVVLDFALAYPGRLRSLVFANSVGSAEIKEDLDYIALAARLRPRDDLPAEVRELSASYRARNPRGTQAWVKLVQETASKKPPFPGTKNRITFSRLEEIEVPALLITGDADPYTPPQVLELFRKRLRNAKSVVIRDCSHSAFWEQPEIFNRAVLDFVASAGAAS
jgi:pimeloyl-ACP methyl ester carboxylesterase